MDGIITLEKKGNTIDFNFRIPANTNAVFYLPLLGKDIISILENNVFIYAHEELIPAKGIELLNTNEKEVIISLASGEYHFVVNYN